MGNRKNSTGWFVAVLIVTAFILIAFAGFCIYIDPFLHYHKPLDGYAYHTVENEPYMNDGIIRQYDFSGVITGSSMTENFKTSEAEQLFGGRFIKIPLNGASFYEHSNQLDRVYSKGKTPSVVIRALDPDGLVVSKDYSRHDYSDIEFIFNDNPFDDVNYIFNLHLFTVHTLALLGNSQPKEMPSMDFDKYCTWEYDTGVDAVLLQDASLPPVDAEELFTDDHKEILLANIRQNVTNMADEHPETTFYCFFSPYSIYYWDSLNSSAKIRWLLEAERTAAYVYYSACQFSASQASRSSCISISDGIGESFIFLFIVYFSLK